MISLWSWCHVLVWTGKPTRYWYSAQIWNLTLLTKLKMTFSEFHWQCRTYADVKYVCTAPGVSRKIREVMNETRYKFTWSGKQASSSVTLKCCSHSSYQLIKKTAALVLSCPDFVQVCRAFLVPRLQKNNVICRHRTPSSAFNADARTVLTRWCVQIFLSSRWSTCIQAFLSHDGWKM